MGKWMQWMERMVGGGQNGAKRINSFRWLLLIGLVGVGLMVMNSFLNVKQLDTDPNSRASPDPNSTPVTSVKDTKDQSGFSGYEQSYEAAIRDILQTVVGVGDSDVLVTIESTEETVVQTNPKDSQRVTTEKDQNGAQRNITEVTRSGEVVLYDISGSQNPIIVKQIKPKVRGVVVVAKGAENATVKSMIVEAVSRGLDVPPHRISVLPRKQQ
ncbi:stage III sporulation protein AG [Paenibacillus koleovorans]|uniref:stage III sporulation protein AG n=1 Tax=Paenibacillus koleovorans TaxID=121608 RepID=UPI000FD6EF3C|nr:stage III sporulation protein AG [Paenibacillus koleovorans]